MEGQNTTKGATADPASNGSKPVPTQAETAQSVEELKAPVAGALAEAKQPVAAVAQAAQPTANAGQPAPAAANPIIRPVVSDSKKTSEKDKKEKIGVAGKLNNIDLAFKVSLADKIFLAKHLSTILKSGISLVESLKIVADQSKGRLKKILDDVISKVENGKALNVALSDHKRDFDPLFISMIKIGEKSGTLDQSLIYLADQLSKDSKLIAKVKSASIYPIIVLVTAVGVGGGVSYFILPKLTKLFASFSAKLPLSTRILMWISKSIEAYGLYWLAGLVLAVLFFWLILKIKIVRFLWQKLVLFIPVAGRLSRGLNLARISLTLGTLLKSSVAIDESLSITSETLTFLPYQRAIVSIATDVTQGKTISEGIEKADPKAKLFDPTTKAMVNVGEKTGSLYNSLLYVSEIYEGDTYTGKLDFSNYNYDFFHIRYGSAIVDLRV